MKWRYYGRWSLTGCIKERNSRDCETDYLFELLRVWRYKLRLS